MLLKRKSSGIFSAAAYGAALKCAYACVIACARLLWAVVQQSTACAQFLSHYAAHRMQLYSPTTAGGVVLQSHLEAKRSQHQRRIATADPWAAASDAGMIAESEEIELTSSVAAMTLEATGDASSRGQDPWEGDDDAAGECEETVAAMRGDIRVKKGRAAIPSVVVRMRAAKAALSDY